MLLYLIQLLRNQSIIKHTNNYTFNNKSEYLKWEHRFWTEKENYTLHFLLLLLRLLLLLLYVATERLVIAFTSTERRNKKFRFYNQMESSLTYIQSTTEHNYGSIEIETLNSFDAQPYARERSHTHTRVDTFYRAARAIVIHSLIATTKKNATHSLTYTAVRPDSFSLAWKQSFLILIRIVSL